MVLISPVSGLILNRFWSPDTISYVTEELMSLNEFTTCFHESWFIESTKRFHKKFMVYLVKGCKVFFFSFIKVYSYIGIFDPIWMSHWHHRATEGAEFWISCKQPAFLINFICLRLGNSKFSNVCYSVASMWHLDSLMNFLT